MSGKQRYTAEQMVLALRETKGMVYLAAKNLGCSHMTVYNYIRRYASVRKEHEYQRGELLDIAEQKLRDAVDKGEQWALQFALKLLGKHRGFTERQEIQHSGPGGGDIPITIKPDLSKLTDSELDLLERIANRIG